MRNQQRIAGFDVARSLAIFGMIVVHFMLVMTDGVPAEKWSDSLMHLLDGRPAATFVILAGIGVTLMSKIWLIQMRRTIGKMLDPIFGDAVCCCWPSALLTS